MRFKNVHEIHCFQTTKERAWYCNLEYGSVEDMEISDDIDVDVLDIELNSIIWKDVAPIDKPIMKKAIMWPIKTDLHVYRYDAQSLSFGLTDDVSCNIIKKKLTCRISKK